MAVLKHLKRSTITESRKNGPTFTLAHFYLPKFFISHNATTYQN